jgi:hypothetical protein
MVARRATLGGSRQAPLSERSKGSPPESSADLNFHVEMTIRYPVEN